MPAFRISVVAALTLALSAASLGAQLEAPLVYDVAFPAPSYEVGRMLPAGARAAAAARRALHVTVLVPTDGRAAVELMMATWTPGHYQTENYAGKVDSVTATSPTGEPLPVQRTRFNRWLVETRSAPSFTLSYRVNADVDSPTGDWVSDSLAVLNGAPTFITIAGDQPRMAIVRLTLPPGWSSVTALDSAQDGVANHYQAANYDELVDAPIVAGRFQTVRFVMLGKPHILVNAGPSEGFSGEQAGRALTRLVAQARRFWGTLPYDQFVFLNVFRPGAGSLAHGSSMLLTANAARDGSATGFNTWLTTVTRNYFQAWNGLRLRPVELGPFDYENLPHSSGLWITEGFSTYFANLLMLRAGFTRPLEWEARMSTMLADLETAPGRNGQTLAASALQASGGDSAGKPVPGQTVDYVNKGAIAAFLLDTHIRVLRGDSANLDDVMRAAYAKYSGPRGYTREQFEAVADSVAGTDLSDWFQRTLDTTDEFDYTEMLNWYGFMFPDSTSSGRRRWILQEVDQPTPDQTLHLRGLMRPDAQRLRNLQQQDNQGSGLESESSARPFRPMPPSTALPLPLSDHRRARQSTGH